MINGEGTTLGCEGRFPSDKLEFAYKLTTNAIHFSSMVAPASARFGWFIDPEYSSRVLQHIHQSLKAPPWCGEWALFLIFHLNVSYFLRFVLDRRASLAAALGAMAIAAPRWVEEWRHDRVGIGQGRLHYWSGGSMSSCSPGSLRKLAPIKSVAFGYFRNWNWPGALLLPKSAQGPPDS